MNHLEEEELELPGAPVPHFSNSRPKEELILVLSGPKCKNLRVGSNWLNWGQVPNSKLINCGQRIRGLRQAHSGSLGCGISKN